MCSPETRRGSRLVARSETLGPARNRVSAIPAAASITCSQLSMTSSSLLARIAPAIRSGDAVPATCVRPSALATVVGTSSGLDKGPSSATNTPSGYLGKRCLATSKPRRVLPIPPAPTRLTSRCAVARAVTSPSSASRPINSEITSGRFVGRKGVAAAPSVTGAMNRYPRRDRVSMKMGFLASSPSTARMAAMWLFNTSG